VASELYKLAIRLTPRSGRDAVLGIKQIEGLDEVQASVTAPPDNGKANKALCKLIAGEIGVAKSKVEVVQGQTSRHKRLGINADQKLIDAWLQQLPRLD
jgi:hypothetical protein